MSHLHMGHSARPSSHIKCSGFPLEDIAQQGCNVNFRLFLHNLPFEGFGTFKKITGGFYKRQ